MATTPAANLCTLEAINGHSNSTSGDLRIMEASTALAMGLAAILRTVVATTALAKTPPAMIVATITSNYGCGGGTVAEAVSEAVSPMEPEPPVVHCHSTFLGCAFQSRQAMRVRALVLQQGLSGNDDEGQEEE